MRNYARVLDVLTVCCAVVAIGFAGWRLFPHRAASTSPAEVKQWKKFQERGNELLAAPQASVTIVEFTDFQCPFCRRMVGTLRALEQRFPGKVRVLVRHFPLAGLHPVAFDAALASECAADRGKFAMFHDLLFSVQDSLGKIGWGSLAARVQISDTAAFSRCVTDQAFSKAIEADRQAGLALKLRGTPTVLVNQWNVGADPAKVFEVVAREIQRQGTSKN